MGRTLPEILMARDTLIFLLQHLGFAISLKKSVLHHVKQIEFLALVIDTEKMTLALPKNIKNVYQQCQEIFMPPKTSVLSLLKLIGLLSSANPDHFTSTNPISISSTGVNISSTEKGVLQPTVVM